VLTDVPFLLKNGWQEPTDVPFLPKNDRQALTDVPFLLKNGWQAPKNNSVVVICNTETSPNIWAMSLYD